jgi:CubicO group peptidase (beta-lactamase class C family)
MLLICIFFINVSCDYNWSSVETQITDKITKGYFTGCILGVYTTPNITLFKKAYGTLSPKNGLYAPSLNLDTVFDINFLTQVLGINSALMQLFDQQKFSINDRVSKYIPDFAKNNKTTITLTHLMMHNSGLQATYSNDFGATPADLLTKIYNLTP